jgi:hypothetical protein
MSTLPSMSHPPKHLVREYLERRSKASAPPPAPDEIRRQLGWGMTMAPPHASHDGVAPRS